MTKNDKETLLLKELSKFGAATANEVINRLFLRDLRKSYAHVVSKGWRHYNHLNKHFTTLEKNGLIKQKGFKRGPSNIDEKVWVPTPKTFKLFYTNEKEKVKIKDLIKSSIAKMKAERKKRPKTKKG